jgi:hypothetical protein
VKRAAIAFSVALALSLLSPYTLSRAATTGAPSAPQSITQSNTSNGVTLSWSAPIYGGAGGVTSYRIEYSTNGSSWTFANTVSSGTTTYAVGGLSPSTTYYFRVAAFSNSTRGANGYPWTKIYGTTAKNRNNLNGIDYESSYGITAGDISTTVSASFTRVRYLLNTTISSVSKYADVDFEKWITSNSDSATSYTALPNISNLRIPTINATSGNQFIIQANVNDLNVYSDNAMVSNGYGMTGRLEIWPWDYGQALSGLKPQGSSTSYDYDDLPSNPGGSYGSFQVHDLDNLKPVFAWNHQDYNVTADIAYGKNPTGNPDWTFCHQGSTMGTCASPTSFRLQIYVNTPITTLANLITTASVSVATNPEYRKATTISYTTTTPGKVTFLEAGKTIAGCKNIAVTTTASCSWKPSKRNAQVVTARLVPTNGSLSTHNATANVYILKRSTSR